MPKKRRLAKSSKRLDHWKIDDLMTGACYLGTGYVPPNNRSGCGHWTAEDWADVHAAMRADWAIHGADVMAWWRGEHDRFTDQFTRREKLRDYLARHDQTEPWAAREFGMSATVAKPSALEGFPNA